MKNIELITASDHNEFFYKDSDEPVNEGDPVGIEWDELQTLEFPVQSSLVHFNLFKNIYWNPNYEEE